MAAYAQSKNDVVREVVAGRLDLPFGLMVTLAHDRVADVRLAIAGNPTAGPAVLEHLANDRAAEVVLALVDNPALPEVLLERLLFHKRDEIRRAAAARLDRKGLALVPDLEDATVPELRDVAVGAWSLRALTLTDSTVTPPAGAARGTPRLFT